MPQIIVAADQGAAFGEGAVTFRETVNVADFDSQHFASQLVERIGWAVEDAAQAERLPAGGAEIPNVRESHNEVRESESEVRESESEVRESESEVRESESEVRESESEVRGPQREERDERVTVPSPA